MKVYYKRDPFTGECTPTCPFDIRKCARVGSPHCKVICSHFISDGYEIDEEGHYYSRYVECNHE
jgi:hypothetical protein